MAVFDTYTQGTPSWVELVTPDQRSAAEFYGASCGCEHAEPFVLVRSLDPL